MITYSEPLRSYAPRAKQPRVSQAMRVLQYLKASGSITRVQAARNVGCFELASRIGELEARGVTFSRVNRSGTNIFNDPTHFTEYTLVSVPAEVDEELRGLTRS